MIRWICVRTQFGLAHLCMAMAKATLAISERAAKAARWHRQAGERLDIAP